MRYIIVGTAGHIDHGKSALVEALTGTNPDRLEEEKRRGITIDLGFAHLDLGDVRIGFVDVPGHERFVRNMLAGAGGLDLVMLVVAADESIKPQTREHFDICRLLGVRKGLVALTKSDLVERDVLDLVTLEVQEFVAGSFLEGAPIVPVSARTGVGLEALKSELRRLGLEVPARALHRPFRLPIDRAFVMKGFGAVVTGTLAAGEIVREQEAELFPLGRRVRVRGIEVHNQSAERAEAGQRTALNVAGVEAREIARGMVLAPPGVFQATERLDAALTLLASARSLKNRARVHFHCGTDEMLAEVVLLDARELAPGGRAYAQLRLTRAGLFLPGDRFIIRQFSPVTTIGGGVVLDNLPERHHAADEKLLEFFRAVEQGDEAARLEKIVERLGECSPADLIARTGWPREDLQRLVRQLVAEKRLGSFGEPPSLLVHPGFFQACTERTLRELSAFHSSRPLMAGIAREDLRGRLSQDMRVDVAPSAALFDAALEELRKERRIEIAGDSVRLPGRGVELSAEERAAREQIAAAFERAGLAVPRASEVLAGLTLDRARSGKILQVLLREKALVRVTEDLIFHHTALEKLRQTLAARKAQQARLSVTDFKDLTGLSRKYAIPLLEYLDRERVTRREGDERVIL